MNITFNLKNTLKKTREQYVKEFRVSGEIKIEPCDKFVSCFEKLSKNYVLALRDNSSIETLQIANQNDIEFYEGYEIIPRYTNDLRKQLCEKLNNINALISNIVLLLSDIENVQDIENKNILNDIKLDFNVINTIIKNIYKHLTMTNNELINNIDNTNCRCKIEQLKQYIVKLINELIDVKSKLIIEYIDRQLDIVIDRCINHYNQIICVANTEM